MSEPKNAMPKPRAGGGVRKTAQQQEFERQHPRSAKGRTGGGQWIQKGAGMTGEPSRDVRHLQDRLTALGYSPGAADGRFGPKTEASVVRFQADYKLRADGQVGPDTTVALRGATPQDAERRRERGLNADLASTGAEYAKESAKEWTKPTPEQLKAEKEAEREAKKERKAKSRRSKASSSRALSKGDGIGSVRGDSQVKQMQQLLDALGYDLGDAGVDGRFGPDTAKAVRKLQRRFGLATDGVFGQQTRRLLTRLAKRTAKKMKTGRADEIATADQNPDLTKGLAEAMSDQQINGLRLPELANLLAGTNAPEYVEEGLTRTLDLLEATRTARLRATGQVAARLLARERVLRRRLEEAEVLSRDRDDLPSSAFVYPRERRYPIHDVDHARRALLRVAESGTEREQLAVREAVEARYPRLDLLEGVVKRGVGRGAVQIRRLPDGTFAPKGLGRVLTPGTKVKMPGTDGKFTHGIVGPDGNVRTYDPKEKDYGKSEGPVVKLGKPAPPKNPASKADAEHLRVARQEHREQLAGEKKRRGERKEQLRKIADDRPLNAYTLTGEAKEHLDRYVAEHGRKPGPAGIKRLQELYPEDFKLTAKGVKAQPAAPKNPANGIDAFKKADGPHGPVYEATDPDGTKLRLRRERTGAVVLETDGMPERFTDEKIAQDRFLAAVKGKDARAKEGAKHLNLGDKPKPTREEREAAAAKKHPLGTKVSTTVHSTGGRSEEVEGEVVGHSRGQLEVKTESGHGTIVVPLDKVNGSKPAPPKNPAKRPDPAEKVYDSMGQAELRTELTNVTGALKNPHHDDQTRARLESRRESILSRLTEMPKAKKDYLAAERDKKRYGMAAPSAEEKADAEVSKKEDADDERWGTRPVSDKGYVGKSAKKPQSPGDEGLTQKEIDAELKRSEKGMAERYTVSYDKPTSQWKINDSKTGESHLAGARTHAEVSKSVERMNEEAAKPKSDTQSKIEALGRGETLTLPDGTTVTRVSTAVGASKTGEYDVRTPDGGQAFHKTAATVQAKRPQSPGDSGSKPPQNPASKTPDQSQVISQLQRGSTKADVVRALGKQGYSPDAARKAYDDALAAIKPKPLPKPPQNPAIPGEGGGFKDNSTSLVDLPIGAEFKLKNGDTYRLHKFTDGGGAIGKPVSVSSGSTAAKFFNGKLAPKQVKQPKTPAPAAPKPKKASGAFNGKNLGPSGKERNVKAMTDAKLKQIVDHPDAEPALKERASAELAKRGGGADTESALKDSIDAAKKGSKYDGVLTPDDLADVKPGDELSHEGTVKTAEKVGKAGVKFTDGSIAPAYDLKRPQPEPPKMSKAPLNVKNLGPSGKERNVKAMSDAKLKELSGHPLVEPALKTRVDAELAKRDGSKVTGPRYKPNPKAPGDLSNDELLAEYDKAYNSAQGKNGESGDEAQAAYEHHKKLHTELTKRHGPEKAAQALKLYREAKGDIEGPKEPDSKPGAKAGGTDAVSKAQAALAKKQAEWDALPADASKEERAKKASQLRAAKYRVKKAGGDPAKPSGAPKDAAPKAGASQVGVLKQGSSGGLGKAHTPTGNKTADESKLAQLKADAATAKGNYESAKAGDAVTPAALSKLASNASAWEQKAKVFEKAMGTDAKPTQAQVSKSQYLNNRLAKPGGSITMPDGYKLRRADNADVEVISNSGKKLGSYGNPADALKAYNEFKREVKAGDVALRAFISAFLDGPHGDKADATPGEPKGKDKVDFSKLAGQPPSKMVDEATKQTGSRETAINELEKAGLLSKAQADKQRGPAKAKSASKPAPLSAEQADTLSKAQADGDVDAMFAFAAEHNESFTDKDRQAIEHGEYTDALYDKLYKYVDAALENVEPPPPSPARSMANWTPGELQDAQADAMKVLMGDGSAEAKKKAQERIAAITAELVKRAG